jgi:agmatinase
MPFKTLPTEGNFLALESKYSSLEDSKIAILSAPYEKTVSYGGGTVNGPKAILDASAYVEFYDDEFKSELCFKHGIVTIEPLKFGKKEGKQALDLIEKSVAELLDAGKFVVTLGGEHTISTAPILAHFNKYQEMSVLHFDAHSDLRESYQGSQYSHASFMARVTEKMNPEAITQVGIRALCKEEAEFIKKNGVNTFFASSIRRGIHKKNWQKQVVKTLNDLVYITFDVDFFDPAIMPSTGTPEPDGFLYHETLEVFRQLRLQGKKIVGFDIVELAPTPGVTHPDILTARLLYKMLNFAFTE